MNTASNSKEAANNWISRHVLMECSHDLKYKQQKIRIQSYHFNVITHHFIRDNLQELWGKFISTKQKWLIAKQRECNVYFWFERNVLWVLHMAAKKVPQNQRGVSSLHTWWTRFFTTVSLPKSLLLTYQRELVTENETSVLLKTLPLVDCTASVSRGRRCSESPHIPSSPFSLRCCEFLWTSLEQ